MVKSFYYFCIALIALTSASCDTGPDHIDIPDTYTFTRDGVSTVNYSGQTARIRMAQELNTALADPNSSAALLFEMYDNQDPQGGDVSPFSESVLNSETKSISEKVAASQDYFATNSVGASKIKQDFRTWLTTLANEVYAASNQLAAPGQPGQIADGTTTRYVAANGLEYNQVISKSLVGALMLDQIVNHYLSPAVLDAGDNVENNNEEVLDGDNNYTTMEHKWDEAYGYLFGNAADPADPLATLGSDDKFLNEYVGKVAEDPDFDELELDIHFSFRVGRAAITQQDYSTRRSQADMLKEHLSLVPAVRAVYYLEKGKAALEVSELGAALHALSEAYGFIYSLQFTRKSGSSDPYFSGAEVDAMLADLLGDGNFGLYTVTSETLTRLAQIIAEKFDFTVAEAAN